MFRQLFGRRRRCEEAELDGPHWERQRLPCRSFRAKAGLAGHIPAHSRRVRIVSALFSLSLLIVPAPAATTLTVSSTNGNVGSTVSSAITLQNATNVAAAQFDLGYPAARLSSGPANGGSALSGHVVRSAEPAPGFRRVVIYSLDIVPIGNGVLANVPLNISPTSPGGVVFLPLTNVILADLTAAKINPVTLSSGSLEVTPTNCAYSISPTNATFGPIGGSGQVQVISADGCAWTNFSNDSWLSIVSSNTSSGTGTLSYSVAANATTNPRSGSLTIAGKTFTVMQSGVVSNSILLVTITGHGLVTPNLSGQSLQLGQTYTMKAQAGAGYAFTNWTGGIVTNSTTIRFVMQSNLVLQANFTPAKFVPSKANYAGLFFETNGVSQQSSGFISISTTAKGKANGSLQIGGSRSSFNGSFDSNGVAHLTARARQLALAVELVVDLTPNADQITGTVKSGAWVADLVAPRAVFDGKTSLSPNAGKYALIIPGSAGVNTQPGGDSYGAVSLDKAGKVKLAGSLADGTKISQGTTVSKDGEWPLYVPLYSGQGSLLSWVLFDNTATNDFSGLLNWFKPSGVKGKFYPQGFSMETNVLGSIYLRPASGQNVLSFSEGEVVLAGAGVTITNRVTLTGAKVKVSANDKLTMTIVPATGLFSGTLVDPVTSKRISFSGVILQKENVGRGYFLGTDQSGQVLFGPVQ